MTASGLSLPVDATTGSESATRACARHGVHGSCGTCLLLDALADLAASP